MWTHVRRVSVVFYCVPAKVPAQLSTYFGPCTRAWSYFWRRFCQLLGARHRRRSPPCSCGQPTTHDTQHYRQPACESVHGFSLTHLLRPGNRSAKTLFRSSVRIEPLPSCRDTEDLSITGRDWLRADDVTHGSRTFTLS